MPPTIRMIGNILYKHPSNVACVYKPHSLKPEEEQLKEDEVKDALIKIKNLKKSKSSTVQILKARETGMMSVKTSAKQLTARYDKELDLISYAYRVFHIKFMESQQPNPTKGVKGYLIDKTNVDLNTIYHSLYEYIPKLAEYFIKDASITVERFSVGINKNYVVFRVNTPHENGYKYYMITHSYYHENAMKPNETVDKSKYVFAFKSYGYSYSNMIADIAHCTKHVIKGRNNSRESFSVSSSHSN
jgi:hypothetical protein